MTRKLKRSINKTKKGGGGSKTTRNSTKPPKKGSTISEGLPPNLFMMLNKSGTAKNSPNTELINTTELKKWGEYKEETPKERKEREKREELIALHKGKEYLNYMRGSRSMAEEYLRREAKKSQAKKSHAQKSHKNNN